MVPLKTSIVFALALSLRTAVVSLSPTVHGEVDKPFVPILINIASDNGFSAYTGEGINR